MFLAIALICTPAFAANGEPVVGSFTYDGAASVNFNDANKTVTVTVPNAYAGTTLDLAKLIPQFNVLQYGYVSHTYNGAATIGDAASFAILTFSYTVLAEQNPGAAYTTEYKISAVRVNPLPAQFSGTIDKAATLPTTSITFTPEDFTAKYTANDGGPLTGIIITGSGGSAGRLLLGGNAYTLGTAIPLSSIYSLVFENVAAGSPTFKVTAVNQAAPSAPGFGDVTLRITLSQDPSLTLKLDEINYSAATNSYFYFTESDFNSVFKDKSGNNLDYVRFTQPPSSVGRLYYNYTSSGNYDHLVASDSRYYRNSNPRISNVAVVPREDYTGTFTIYYTAYDETTKVYEGTIRVQVSNSGADGSVNNSYSSSNTVTYSADKGVPIYFSSADFRASLTAATGLSLSHIRFTSLPSSSAGLLRYNYGSSSSSASGTGVVTTGTRYYVNASPDISGISFVPTATYAGVLNVPYTAYASNGAGYGGTLILRIGQAVSSAALEDINYSMGKNAAVKLSAADIDAVFLKVAKSSLSYIIISPLPSAGTGTLYYNYRGANNYDAAVSASIRYFRLTNPNISNISFVPKAGQTGRAAISYTAYTASGAAYVGKINITLSAPKSLKTLSYQMVYGDPLVFGDAGIPDGIRALVRQAAGAGSSGNLSHAVFEVPATTAGVIYKNYSAQSGLRVSIAASEEFFADKTPSIADLAFFANTDRNVTLKYTAYSASGEAFNGKITLKQITLPAGWSREEVGSLARRGVPPDSLLSDYESLITRAEFTALLVRTYDYSGASQSGAPARTAAFTDIRGNPFARLISRGFSLMIIDGVSADRFDPDSPLTREAAAKILCSAIRSINGINAVSGSAPPYADNGAISYWAMQYVAFAYENGLMIGSDGNRFRPQDSLSREEAMALVERAIVKYKF